MGNARSCPGEKAARTKGTRHDAVSKRRNGILEWVIHYNAWQRVILIVKGYRFVRAVDSATVLLIRRIIKLLLFLIKNVEKKIEVTCMDYQRRRRLRRCSFRILETNCCRPR